MDWEPQYPTPQRVRGKSLNSPSCRPSPWSTRPMRHIGLKTSSPLYNVITSRKLCQKENRQLRSRRQILQKLLYGFAWQTRLQHQTRRTRPKARKRLAYLDYPTKFQPSGLSAHIHLQPTRLHDTSLQYTIFTFIGESHAFQSPRHCLLACLLHLEY